MLFRTCVVARLMWEGNWCIPLQSDTCPYLTVLLSWYEESQALDSLCLCFNFFRRFWADSCPWQGIFNLPYVFSLWVRYMSAVFVLLLFFFILLKIIFANSLLLYELHVMSSWFFTCFIRFWCHVGTALYILAFFMICWSHVQSKSQKLPLYCDNIVMTVLID